MSEIEEEKTPLRVTVTLKDDLREAFLVQRKKMALDAISRNVALPSDSEVLTALVAGCSLPVAEPEEGRMKKVKKKLEKEVAHPMRHTEEDEDQNTSHSTNSVIYKITSASSCLLLSCVYWELL